MASHRRCASLRYYGVRYQSSNSLIFLALRRQILPRPNFHPGSFLVSVFEKCSQAMVIACYFEKLEGTPDGGKIRVAPGLERFVALFRHVKIKPQPLTGVDMWLLWVLYSPRAYSVRYVQNKNHYPSDSDFLTVKKGVPCRHSVRKP